MPPYEVLNETLKRGKIDLGMSGKIEWKPCSLTQVEYHKVCSKLGIDAVDESILPEWVSTYENWDIYQYEITHEIPAEEHYDLHKKELTLIQRKEILERNGVEGEEYEMCLLQLMRASNRLSEYLSSYFNKTSSKKI